MPQRHRSYAEQEEEDARYLTRLKKMSVAQLREELDRKLKSEIIAAILDLEDSVKATAERMTRDVIASSLGLEKDSFTDRWQLKNDGNPLTRALGERAYAEMTLALPDFVASILEETGPVSLPRLKKEFRKVYTEKTYVHLRELLDRWAEAESVKSAEAALADIFKDTEYVASIKKMINDQGLVEDDEEGSR